MAVRRLFLVVAAALVAAQPAFAGPLKGWGADEHGQLDGGIFNYQAQPTPMNIMGGVRAAGAGQSHSLAVKKNGTVWAWGQNGGRLGNGDTADSATPVQVAGLANAVAVAGSWTHSLALLGDGTVWAWGGNDSGQLGNGTTTSSLVPVQVSGLTNIVAIDAEYAQSFALARDGTLWAWGENGWGQVGNGTTIDQLSPVAVLSGVKAVAAGQSHTLALKSDGTVWAWGNNWFGQLGQGTQTDGLQSPTQVPGLTGMTAIGAGYDHSLAVTASGTVYAWGDNLYGQVALPGGYADEFRTSPVPIAGPTGVIAVTGGWTHSLALGADGHYWGWGADGSGQLGDGTANGEAQAPALGLAHGLGFLVAGQSHTLGL